MIKEEIIAEENPVLKSIVTRSADKPKVESLVEGPVILVEKSSVYVDLAPFGTGIIYGREFINAKDIIKKISLGDIIKAKVVEAEKAIKLKTILNLEIKDANKGGLILEWQGIQGFLPASQLKAEHYPRVLDSDKDKILKELKKLVGEKISVMIISTLPKEGKLIFSEKDNNPEEKKEILSKYSVGDVLECIVAGIVDFGVFLRLEEGLEGLVHISELDWGLVEDPRALFKVGDKVKAKVIEIKDGKISLSIKALKDNPWKEFEGKLKKGDIIKGVVIKYNKHGALVSIKEGVAGLVHNSTINPESKLREKLELGKNYNFQITLFEPKDQKMTLVHLEQISIFY